MNNKLLGLLIKENVFENWKRFIANLFFFLTIFIIIVSFILLLPIYQHNFIAYYENSEFDIIIESCSEKQMIEYKETELISEYKNYRLFTNVSLFTERFLSRTSLMAFEDFDNLNITFFPDKNIIKQAKSNESNQIYIDYTVSKELDISLLDSVSLQVGEEKIDFIVTRIYENVSFAFKSTCLVLWQSELRNKANVNGEIGINGSLAKLGKSTTMDAIKDNYIAEGILKDRPDELTDEEWNAYLDDFYSHNYSSLIIGKKQSINDIKNDLRYTPPIILGLSLIGIVLIVFFSYKENKRNIESHKKQFAILNALGLPKLKYLLFFVCGSIIIQIPTLFISTILSKLLIYNLIVKTSFMPWYFLFQYFWLFAMVVMISIFFSNLLVYLKIRKLNTSFILAEE